MGWFRRHLNVAWLLGYIVTIVVAFICCPSAWEWLTPWMEEIGQKVTLGGLLQMAIPVIIPPFILVNIWGKKTTLEALLFWIVYLVCTLIINRWVLKEKGRSLWWLWVTMLLFTITPLILGNKKTIVSDLIQSQTSESGHSGDYSEIHTHSDKTGDI
jgi:hypothetical protein